MKNVTTKLRIVDEGINVQGDFQRFKRELKKLGLWDRITELMKPSPLASLSLIFLNLLITIALTSAMLFATNSSLILALLLLPITVIVFSSRIRALGNQCHDAVHYNILRSKRSNEVLSRFFLFPLLWYDYELYFKEHWSHHRHLGDIEKDLEKINRVIKIPDEGSVFRRFLALYSTFFMDWRFWLSSTFGDISRLGLKRGSLYLFWWMLWLSFLSIVGGIYLAMVWSLLWLFSRMTIYHGIKVLCELCDHYRLENKTVVLYTRTMPRNILSLIFHPENDNYHVLHHLFPKIPMPNLHKAHKLMMYCKEYRNGEILSAYFFGRKAVIKSLIS